MAKADGDYEFGIDNADDRCSFWIDLDQDGVFESSGDKGAPMQGEHSEQILAELGLDGAAIAGLRAREVIR